MNVMDIILFLHRQPTTQHEIKKRGHKNLLWCHIWMITELQIWWLQFIYISHSMASSRDVDCSQTMSLCSTKIKCSTKIMCSYFPYNQLSILTVIYISSVISCSYFSWLERESKRLSKVCTLTTNSYLYFFPSNYLFKIPGLFIN